MRITSRLIVILLLLSTVGLQSAVAGGATGTVQIDDPAADAVLSGVVPVHGTAMLTNTPPAGFRHYSLDYARVDDANHRLIVTGQRVEAVQVNGGLLDTWDTTLVPNGIYVVRLQIYSSRGMAGETSVTVSLSNDLPPLTPIGWQIALLGTIP